MAGENVVAADGQSSPGLEKKTNGIVEFTDASFDADVLKSDQPVMVDFWAAWCGPCKALAPIVEEVATAYNGKIKVGKMDVDKNVATPQRYGIRGIPTLLIFKDGKVQEQIVGYVPKETIQKALDKHISG
jgi:thioredoxin 1